MEPSRKKRRDLHADSGITVKHLLLFLACLSASGLWIGAEASSADRPFYEELAVGAHNCTQEEIAEAYNRISKTWTPEKLYTSSELRKIISVEHAYAVLSDGFRRRDYDYFTYDYLEAEAESAKKQYEGKSGLISVDFPLWVPPKAYGEGIGSAAEVVTYQNFGDLVLHSLQPWVVEIYSVASPECHAFGPAWNRSVALMEGVVKVGRIEFGEMPLPLILAERNWLHGHPFYRSGLPALIAVQPECAKLKCITRYFGEKNSEAITDWVGSQVLRLPRILFYSAKTLMSDIILKPGPHKVKVIQFSTTGERAPLYLRKAAKDYVQYAVFAMVLWRESEETFWESKVGVTGGPATVFLKDPGLPPVIYHGNLNSSTFLELMEEHKTFELPQLRSITSTELGCNVRDNLWGGDDLEIWYCVIVVGRPSLELNVIRGIARQVLEQLTIAATENISSAPEVTPGVQAFKDKRLSLAWLDGELQKAFCFFYLNSPNMFEACGPKKYEVDDIPKIFLIRYSKLEKETSDLEKKRWMPKTQWESKAEEESRFAAQLVTRYNGSADVTQIMEWISRMVTEGDNEDLPSFRGKPPDLVAEESTPLMANALDFVAKQREAVVQKGKGVSYAFQDFLEDPKFLPIILFISFFYAGAFYLSAKDKKKKHQVPPGIVPSGVQEEVSQASSPAEGSTVIAQKPSTASKGLRKREPHQRS